MIPIISYRERDARLKVILSRKASFDPLVDDIVRGIIDEVRISGDAALLAYTQKFDRVTPSAIAVPLDRLDAAHKGLSPRLRDILTTAIDNVRQFHTHQTQQSWFMDDGDGVLLGQRIVPIERVGVYVPGREGVLSV